MADGAATLGRGSPAVRRLEEVRDCFAFMREVPSLLACWCTHHEAGPHG
jgi:hypothetical protein